MTRTAHVTLFLSIVLAACQSGAADPVPGERVATFAASPQTIAETGVTSWELYRDAVQLTALGLDGTGTPVYRQESKETIVDDKRALDITISEPGHRVFRVTEAGDHDELEGSVHSRAVELGRAVGADLRSLKPVASFGSCGNCSSYSTWCGQYTGYCGGQPAYCPTAAYYCGWAGYYCGCCYLGTSNC
jgi:hypothetical protein